MDAHISPYLGYHVCLVLATLDVRYVMICLKNTSTMENGFISPMKCSVR
jgi:hypothetical protein